MRGEMRGNVFCGGKAENAGRKEKKHIFGKFPIKNCGRSMLQLEEKKCAKKMRGNVIVRQES